MRLLKFNMNWITIIGIVFISLGTVLTYLGSSRDSKKNTKSVETKLEEFSNKLDSINAQPISDLEKQDKLSKISDEFTKWADEFVATKEKKKLDLQKIQIENKSNVLDLNSQWRPHFDRFFSDIKNIIDAYNSKTKNKITYDIKELPKNIIDKKSGLFESFIYFKNDIIWKISVNPGRNIAKRNLPSLEIEIFNEIPKTLAIPNDQFIFVFNDGDNYMLLVNIRNTKIDLSSLPKKYQLEDDTFSRIAKDLLELQLLQL